MSVPTAVRLPFRFDAAALAADAAALAADAWEPHFNTRQYEGDWSGVPLRIAAGGALALYPDPTSDRFEDNEPLGRCPSVIDALAQLKCPVQTVRFLRLGPGSRIKEHRDHRLSYADGELRLHVPVTTDSDVDFRVGGSTVTMAPGDVWYLDLSQSHSVTNFGVHVRVHLAIDCVVNYWLSARSSLLEALARHNDPSYTSAVDPWGIRHTRRSVLAGAAAAAVVLMTPRPSWAGGRLDELSRSAFAPMLGQTFTLTGPLGTVRATLDDVGDLVGAPVGAEGRFSLLFRAPATVRAADGTYTVANRGLGSQSLFLVPVDRGASARMYQAIVNRV